MATLDLSAATPPTNGARESQHPVDVGTTYTLVITPLARLLRSSSVRGNDGGLIWSTSAAEGGTPNANDPKVAQGSDDQVFSVDPLQSAYSRINFGLASQSGTVQAVVFLQWR